ncbi:hypothetical protein ACFVH0_36005 [Streptomyces sp. NPDC127117]|uniref:hypothetical protein n=1 Tax=Streptomyces sp. NPDC127117 TaxID=3345368 RepID=UPI0036271272
MRIRITAAGSVSDGAGLRVQSGQVVTVDDDLARSWIAAGHAIEETTSDSVRTGGQGKQTATRRAPRKAEQKP